MTLAQDTAHCTDDNFAGFTNSKGEDPCAVDIQYGRLCDRSFSESPLSPGHLYNPVDANPTDCKCSTVHYTLLNLCGRCQGGGTVIWPQYSANCTNVFENELPPSFPLSPAADIAIPHWAFTPLAANGTVDLTAIRVDNQPDVVINVSSTAQSTGSDTTSPTETTSSSAPFRSQTADGEGRQKGLNTAAIAGGVVGGVLGLGTLTTIAFLVRRRSIQRRRACDGSESADVQPSALSSGRVSSEQGSASRVASQYLEKMHGSNRLYNPDDPSTFPPSLSATPPAFDRQSVSNSTSPGVVRTSLSHYEFNPYRPAPEM
ncbi:hypothetical protein VKT23_009386 [Stygiomarasmius scandens]|uniref:Epidermal growth factor receptor-like transmembrane-juxtamembrane segment domain-containing protein n=1 Tax=Marasmiellus scandens TaxID=2682957 RepID=A0ABR1JG66_9AGAR